MRKQPIRSVSDITPLDVVSIVLAFIGLSVTFVAAPTREVEPLLAAVAIVWLAAGLKIASSRVKARHEREDRERVARGDARPPED